MLESSNFQDILKKFQNDCILININVSFWCSCICSCSCIILWLVHLFYLSTLSLSLAYCIFQRLSCKGVSFHTLLCEHSLESVMPSSQLMLGRLLLLLPPTPPSIRVFSNESTLHMRWPKYWSFSFSIIPSKEHRGLISFRMDWLDLLAVQELSRVFYNTTVQKHQFFGAQPSSQSNSHIHTRPLEKP